MADDVVVQFPTNLEREVRIAEAHVEKALAELQLSPEVRERLLTRLRPFFEALLNPISDLSFSIDFCGPIPKPQADAMCAKLSDEISQIVNNQIRNLISRVVTERTNREIQDCRDAGLL